MYSAKVYSTRQSKHVQKSIKSFSTKTKTDGRSSFYLFRPNKNIADPVTVLLYCWGRTRDLVDPCVMPSPPLPRPYDRYTFPELSSLPSKSNVPADPSWSNRRSHRSGDAPTTKVFPWSNQGTNPSPHTPLSHRYRRKFIDFGFKNLRAFFRDFWFEI